MPRQTKTRTKPAADRRRDDAPVNPGRDQKGRFAPGNRGGPGNPFARRCAKLRALLINSATDEVIELIARKLVELCLAGNVQAMKLYLAYVINKPTEPVCDPDQLHHHEHQCWEQDAIDFLHLKPLMDAPNMDMLMEATRIARQQVTDDSNRAMCGMATASEKEIKQFKKKSEYATPEEANAMLQKMGKAPEWDPNNVHIRDLAPNPVQVAPPPSPLPAGGAMTPTPTHVDEPRASQIAPPSTNGQNGQATRTDGNKPRGLHNAASSTNGGNGHATPTHCAKPRGSQKKKRRHGWLPPELRNERRRLTESLHKKTG